MPCPECGIPGDPPDPGLSRWQCTKCGNGYFLRRCSACARVSFVDGLQGFRQPWPCTWCGQFNSGFRQNQDPAAASAADLVAEVAALPAAAAAPGPEGGGPGGPAAATGARPRVPGQAAADAGGGKPPASGRRKTPWRSRRRVRRTALALAMAAIGASALAAASGAGMAAGGAGRGGPAAPAGRGGTSRAVQVAVGPVGTVDLHGVPGRLSVVGTGRGRVTLTGQLNWAGRPPAVVTRLDRADRVLTVTVRCAPASPCTQDLRLAVPADTAAAIRQPAGRILVTGLAGPLRLTAASADISASGLRSPELAAVITSGHLGATFAAPPRRVDITLASAQATLRLPARVPYRVIGQVTSGHISVGIPQASTAAGTVTARLDSGELELLPAR